VRRAGSDSDRGARAALRARLLAAAALLAVLALVTVPAVQGSVTDRPDACDGTHWVAAWLAAPQGSSLGRADDAPFGEADGLARSFTDQTLRMVVTPSTAGSAVRVRFGNRFGVAPVAVQSASLATRADGASAVAGTLRPLTFDGVASATIPPLGELVSDPLYVDVDAFRDLLVSLHVAGPAVLDHHQWAIGAEYAAPTGTGDRAGDEAGAAFTETLSGVYAVAGLDVLAPRSVGAVVTLGDSITDGVGSSPDRHGRWPDVLARRLAAAGRDLAVVNAGIAGNHVVTSGLGSATAIGPSARERLHLDVLAQAGVTDVVVFEGINDVFMSAAGDDIVSRLIAGYGAIVTDAHAAGLRVIGATMTPASLSAEDEAARLAVNDWIRTSGTFDSVVDFDEVARDPSSPTRLRPEWDAGMAHLNDAGYAALADAVSLDTFTGTGC
jgi:lysophospholipase L1-like esterase